MCSYFCIGFINFILKGKILLEIMSEDTVSQEFRLKNIYET